MNRSSQRGVALVITLIMLSVVTIMAVAFLAISRRERISVTTFEEQTDARYAAEMALARARVEVASRIIASSNRAAFGALISTNYTRDGGFDRALGADVYNVGYTNEGGAARTLDDSRQNLANLFFDSRPPVFVTTNSSRQAPPDFRYFVDMNRNGRFDPPTNEVVTIGTLRYTNLVIGDPQWVGVPEHPDALHSATNRMLWRYAYLVVPSGRALDLNFIHNHTKSAVMTQDGFSRNQGLASWELNLGGFFRELNTNLWNTYKFEPLLGTPSLGLPYQDALKIVNSRYSTNVASLTSFDGYYEGPSPAPFLNTFFDIYADGPILTDPKLPDPASPGFVDGHGIKPWPGSDTPRRFNDVQELFYLDSGLNSLSNRLRGADVAGRLGTSDHTFYKLLSQLGTESPDSRYYSWLDSTNGAHRRAKMNLNYAHGEDANISGFFRWEPLQFFSNAVDRLVREQFTFDRFGFSYTNIPVRYTNYVGNLTNRIEYGPDFHRLLQLAVNLYDASTNNTALTGYPYLPTVFRPLLYRMTEKFAGGAKVFENIYIGGFQEVTNTTPLFGAEYKWLDLDDPLDVQKLPTAAEFFNPNTPAAARDFFNCYGVPWVVGVKKGYPSFNQAFWQAGATVTRRLQLRKPANRPDVTVTASPNLITTNVQYQIDLSPRVTLEAWNSYGADFRREHHLYFSDTIGYGFSNEVRRMALLPAPIADRTRTETTPRTNVWQGVANASGSFRAPIDFAVTNSFIYDAKNGILMGRGAGVETNTLFYYPASERLPVFSLQLTNRMVYALIDDSVAGGRIVDLVTLKSVVQETNLFARFTEGANLTRRPNEAYRPDHLWDTNRTPASPTRGMFNQVSASTNYRLSAAVFRPKTSGNGKTDNEGNPINDKNEQILKLKYFLFRDPQFLNYGVPIDTNAIYGYPISVTANYYLTDRHMVNDPLVHYTLADLRPGPTWFLDPQGRGSPGAGDTNYIYSHVGKPMAQRQPRTYAPWGQSPIFGALRDGAFATDMAYKDPGITKPDDWDFPSGNLPNLGWIGRVHRGTPWQTVYLKATNAPLGDAASLFSGKESWALWSGSFATHPSNDRKLLHLFTTAVNDNAARGLLSVNQSGRAAWAAVLSGVNVSRVEANGQVDPVSTFIDPATPEFHALVDSINLARMGQTNLPPGLPPDVPASGVFTNLGSFLAAPALSDQSPFLKAVPVTTNADAIVERIPQQILSLVREDSPHFTIYSFGQSLKPAPGSLVTAPGPFYGLCTNYQITGEFITKTVLRFDGPATNLQAVVESHRVLTPQ